jgi:drug/metabolite transporter (DMT)-like permease
LFPLSVAALITTFVHTIFVRLPVVVLTFAWSAIGITLKEFADYSVYFGVTWKSARRAKVVSYLSLIFVLLCALLHNPHIKLRLTRISEIH